MNTHKNSWAFQICIRCAVFYFHIVLISVCVRLCLHFQFYAMPKNGNRIHNSFICCCCCCCSFGVVVKMYHSHSHHVLHFITFHSFLWFCLAHTPTHTQSIFALHFRFCSPFPFPFEIALCVCVRCIMIAYCVYFLLLLCCSFHFIFHIDTQHTQYTIRDFI